MLPTIRPYLLRGMLAVLLLSVGLAWLAGAFREDSRLHHLSASLGAPVERSALDRASDRAAATRAATDRRTRAAVAAALKGGDHWTAAWGAAAQAPTAADAISERGFRGETLRELVFSSLGGSVVRVRFTNAFGTRPLKIARAAVALAATGPDVMAGTSRQLSFAGRPNVTLAPGGQALSDPVLLDVRPLARLEVSLYLPRATGPATQHAQSHETNWIASGSHILDGGTAFDRRTGAWFFLDRLDVLSPPRIRGTVVAIGDSITAGVGTGQDTDANWPADLARRLQALAGPSLGVVDEGIGGNRVLNDSRCCGLRATERFAPDVLSQPGVRDVVLLEGINDIGYSRSHGWLTAPHTSVSAWQIIAGLKQIVAQAHAHRLAIVGGTLLPFKGARYWSPGGEAKRETVNHWITTSHAFDAVIDFARIMRDPAHPLRLDPRFDSGDHLHPNSAGYQAMANAVDLTSLLKLRAPRPAAVRRGSARG